MTATMPTLILMRHAKAVRETEAPTDRERALTPAGRAAAAAAGLAIAGLDALPGIALVSSATRTRQTWAAVSTALPQTTAIFDDGLYLADPGHIWRTASAQLDKTTSVLVIGHNPGLHDLAAALVALACDNSRAGRQVSEDFPTAAMAAFSVEAGPLEAASPRLNATWRP